MDNQKILIIAVGSYLIYKYVSEPNNKKTISEKYLENETEEEYNNRMYANAWNNYWTDPANWDTSDTGIL